ncbi:Homeobox-leucine zipper protein ATHB-14 [Abeliophyllum distichum]|uniref:Homeobox-leucine zipper protein ATHB-14 n=1 Tax=Abeliophyllum distichum TaxID=126358 RepID=A0ABD1NP46_9LAMI
MRVTNISSILNIERLILIHVCGLHSLLLSFIPPQAWSVPEVLRPLYESSKILAQQMTTAALRYARQIAKETNGEVQCSGGRQPAVLRALSQKLCRGFNDAVNGFIDDGWSIMGSDGVEDITIAINSSPSKFFGSQCNSLSMLPTFGGILCARASMLLQDVPPALLIRFLREHRSEWADYGVDAYCAASLKASPYAFLEIVRLEGHAFSPKDIALSRDMYLLQLCSGVDETSGACSQLVFAPIDESFGDDAPLLPFGFRVIPLDSKTDGHGATRTLDLASALEVGPGGARPAGEVDASNQNLRSVLTIAFQFAFENHYRDSVAAMDRHYVRSIVGSVQRVAMAIAPSRLSSHMVPKPLPGSPEAVTLAQWICRSYRYDV